MQYIDIVFSNSNVSIAAKQRGPLVVQCFATYITTSFETRDPFNRLHIVLDAGHLAVSCSLLRSSEHPVVPYQRSSNCLR
jgi:hypothetical protein